MYPNPSSDYLHIMLDDQLPQELHIYSSHGQLIYFDQNYRSGDVIRVKDFPAGNYFVRLQDQNSIHQFIKN